ncbi:hypothetical protein BC833DRAFT_605281 [Globomyces pollinis-pini]|nr:hypothetical protein BC833DRAFT_605281 [Globomyces pollinis-pini]
MSLMKAIQVASLGDSSVLTCLSSIARPTIKSNEILVKNAFSGVNFIDTYHRTGLYKLPLPFIPGREGSGTIVEVGDEVKDFTVGNRVAYTASASYAEFTVVNPGTYRHSLITLFIFLFLILVGLSNDLLLDFAITLPDSVSFEQGSGLLLQGLTGMALTKMVHVVKPGETVLIHAAAGGTGLVLVQLCKHFGATVIGTTSTPEKKALALKAGADHVILYKEEDIVERVKALTNNQGVNAVFDGVGKTTFDVSLACLSKLGSMVSFGNASGKVDPIDIMKLVPKCIRLTRPSLFQLVQTRADFLSMANELMSLMAENKLTIHISNIIDIENAYKAHDVLESGTTTGKILLKL